MRVWAYVVETLVGGRFGGSIEPPLLRSKGRFPVDEMEEGVRLRLVIEFDAAVMERPASSRTERGCMVCCGSSRLCVHCALFDRRVVEADGPRLNQQAPFDGTKLDTVDAID